MPIGPVSDSHRQISVVEPVSPALEHVKRMLFKPFDLGKWFTIGFCAWLAFLGESGGSSFNYSNNNGFSHNNSNQSEPNFHEFYDKAHDWTLNNLSWIIPLGIFLVFFCLALWILMLWLNSRGKFMFLHCVALDKAEVAEPWHKFKNEANSLFWFRLALGLAGMILTLPLLVVIAVVVVRMVLHGAPDVAGIMISVVLACAFVLLAIVFAIVQKFTADFVVSILFLRGGKCLDAWKEFYGLLRARAGQFILYILFQIAIGMAIGVIVLLAVLLTCCIAGCLMVIPYIGTVLLLPVLIFKRAYSLYFLQQFGTSYDVFPPAPPAPPTATGLQPMTGTPPR